MPFYSVPAHEGVSLDAFQRLLYEHKLPPFKADMVHRERDFYWRSDMVATSDVTLLRAQYRQDWVLRPQPVERALAVIIPTQSGGFLAKSGSQEVSIPCGQALLMPTDRLEEIRMINEPALLNSTLVFSAASVQRALAGLLDGLSFDRVQFEAAANFESGEGRWVRDLLKVLASGMLNDRILERSPLALELLIEAVLNILVSRFSSAFVDERGKMPPAMGARQTRLAVDYMNEHLHLPITIGDIAASVGVGVRSLQLAFRRDMGTTPIAYLQYLRLQAVHRELSCFENILPVQEVALKWGFTHMGRFAAHYRRAFGELPSQTARTRSIQSNLRRRFA